LAQGVSLLRRWLQFQLDCQSHHIMSIAHENGCFNGSRQESGRRSYRRSPIPPTPEGAGFLGEFL
jgi:hypothetical protein